MAYKAQNSQSQTYAMNSDVPARTPPNHFGVHGEDCANTRFMCTEQSRVDGALYYPGAEGEIHFSRRKGRRFRREAKRLQRKINRSAQTGSMNEVFSYRNLFKAGKDCCKSVRWKHSVQRFEAHLFSKTAASRRAILRNEYRYSPYVHFTLVERGKARRIDAPKIDDRQVEKVLTREVLLPLYLPSMIYNNGASLPGKGFSFSREHLKNDLREHYRKYGRDGGIILTDGKQFFPSANHDKLYERHRRFIYNADLRSMADKVIDTVESKRGMPLGVEPSQAEMIAYPSDMDNYMQCQMRLRRYGHYMDDFYVIVPPDMDYRKIIAVMKEQAERCGITLNDAKTRYIPLTKPFRFCKAKYILTETGKVIIRASKTSMPRARRKIKALYEKYRRGEVSLNDIWMSINGSLAYLEQYNEHNNILKLRRNFYKTFGFSCESYEQIRTRCLCDT